jgi:hypothetical protein
MLRLRRTTAHAKPTLRQALHLLSGKDWRFLDPDEPALSDDALQGLWERYRQDLTAFCQQYKRGSECWAYYRFTRDIPAPRAHFDAFPWPTMPADEVERWLGALPSWPSHKICANLNANVLHA